MIIGLIPLHNAASYGHLDIAALLIKYHTNVNATDRWGFTPLHEASQKGRTSLCALLLNHGADPTLRNLENQTALDLATAEDVRCLLMDAMAPLNLQIHQINSDSSNQAKDKNISKGCTTTNTESATVISNNNTLNEQMFNDRDSESNLIKDLQQELVTIIGNSNNCSSNEISPNRTQNSSPNMFATQTNSTMNNSSNYDVLSAAQLLLLQKNRANVNEDNTPDSNKPDGDSHVTNTMSYKNKSTNNSSDIKNSSTSLNTNASQTSNTSSKKSIVSISSFIDAALPTISMQEFLTSLHLPHLIEIFEKEMISIDILAEMGHEELKQIGVQAYGHRHKLLKAVEKLLLHTAALQQKQSGNQSGNKGYYDAFLYGLTDDQRKDIINSQQTTLIDLNPNDQLFKLVEEEMQSTIREHKDGHACGGKFTR